MFSRIRYSGWFDVIAFKVGSYRRSYSIVVFGGGSGFGGVSLSLSLSLSLFSLSISLLFFFLSLSLSRSLCLIFVYFGSLSLFDLVFDPLKVFFIARLSPRLHFQFFSCLSIQFCLFSIASPSLSTFYSLYMPSVGVVPPEFKQSGFLNALVYQRIWRLYLVISLFLRIVLCAVKKQWAFFPTDIEMFLTSSMAPPTSQLQIIGLNGAWWGTLRPDSGTSKNPTSLPWATIWNSGFGNQSGTPLHTVKTHRTRRLLGGRLQKSCDQPSNACLALALGQQKII